MSAKDEIIAAATKRNDRKIVEEFFRQIPLGKRIETIESELNWHRNADGKSPIREKALPEYCYNIFDKFERTYFASFPKFRQTITGDFALVKTCKTAEEAKQVLSVDWLRLGRLFGIALRGKRYVLLENIEELRRDGFFATDPKKQRKIIELWVGKPWPARDGKITPEVENFGTMMQARLKEQTAGGLQKTDELLACFNQIAYEWGSDAMANFSQGIAEGLVSFIDENRQLVGETTRANIYWFLLLAWPEIQGMLALVPKKTISDLHTWMLPFMRHGITSLVDKETLRDVCGPLPGGIGLILRPIISRSRKSSD